MCPCVVCVVCPGSVLDTILNVSELVNAVSGVQKESKSGYFWDSDRFWIQILNVSELENAVSGVQKESKSGNRVPFGPPLPCGCNLVFVYLFFCFCNILRPSDFVRVCPVGTDYKRFAIHIQCLDGNT